MLTPENRWRLIAVWWIVTGLWLLWLDLPTLAAGFEELRVVLWIITGVAALVTARRVRARLWTAVVMSMLLAERIISLVLAVLAGGRVTALFSAWIWVGIGWLVLFGAMGARVEKSQVDDE